MTLAKSFETAVFTSKLNYHVVRISFARPCSSRRIFPFVFSVQLTRYIVGRLTSGSKRHLFCLQPGFWNLFILDDATSQALKDRVDRYCAIQLQIDPIFDRVINGLRYDQVRFSPRRDSRRTCVSLQLQNYFSDLRFSSVAFDGLAGIFFTMNNVGPTFDNDVRLTMESLSAVSELLSRTKTAGLNLYA